MSSFEDCCTGSVYHRGILHSFYVSISCVSSHGVLMQYHTLLLLMYMFFVYFLSGCLPLVSGSNARFEDIC